VEVRAGHVTIRVTTEAIYRCLDRDEKITITVRMRMDDNR
jgi:hypothetical protein